jgi:hypothetical protein
LLLPATPPGGALPAALVARVIASREARRSLVEIVARSQLPVSNVVRLLRHRGLHLVPPIHAREPFVRYEHTEPGTLVQLDVEKLNKITRSAIASTAIACAARAARLRVRAHRGR